MSQTGSLSHDGIDRRSGTAAGPTAAALAGRVLLSIVFLLSGLSKLAAPEATIAKISAAGLPLAPLGFAFAVAVETVGALLLIAGYRTRWIAAIFVLYTLATGFAFHNQLVDRNQFIHFYKNMAIAGGFLQLVAFGGGAFSLDGRLIRQGR